MRSVNFVDGTAEGIAAITKKLREDEIDIGLIGIGENTHIAFNDPPANFDTREAYIVVDLDENQLSGTPQNEALAQMVATGSEEKAFMRELYKEYFAASTEEERKFFEAKYDSVSKICIAKEIAAFEKTYSENSNNVLGAYALYQLIKNTSIIFLRMEEKHWIRRLRSSCEASLRPLAASWQTKTSILTSDAVRSWPFSEKTEAARRRL
jgi:hypothetical protein